MTARKKKKGVPFKSIFLIMLSLLLMTGSSMTVRADGQSHYPKRTINVVYDDSGSMYRTNGNTVDTWCQAKYSMEVFAAMLGEADTLNVYYMSDYEGSTGKPPRLRLSGADGAAANVAKIHNETTRAGNTPFNSVRKALTDLKNESADEKWLVILTDGAFEDGAISKEEIDAFLASKDADIKIMFLAMGAGAAGITPDEENGIFYEEAASNSQILRQVTDISTRIFNSNRLDLNASDKRFSFDVPMGELIVFAQGANVEIEGIKTGDGKLIKSAKTPVEVKYSSCDATNYSNQPVTGLQGSIATFIDDFSEGEYTAEVSGAETVEIYYKPNVDVAFYLKDSSGKEVSDMTSIEAGEYTLEFGLVKAGTDRKVAQSELLGEVTYEAVISGAGEEGRVYRNGDSIAVGEGPFALDATARYLKYNTVSTHLDFSAFRNKEVTFSIEHSPTYTVDSHGITNPDDAIRMIAKVDGRQVTKEEWETMEVPGISLAAETRDFQIFDPLIDKTENPGEYRIVPVMPDKKPSTGTYRDTGFEVSYRQRYGDETWSGSTAGVIKLVDNRSWWERNWHLFVKLVVSGIILFIVAGYMPFIKHYLPKSLAKRPYIRAVPNGFSRKSETYSGRFEKKLSSTIIPYVAQRGTIRTLPGGTGGMSRLEVKALGRNRLALVNCRSFAGKTNITFDDEVIEKETRKYTIYPSTVVKAVLSGWRYECTLDSEGDK